jgi:hypothetical protein
MAPVMTTPHSSYAASDVAPEQVLALDMLKRAVPVAPALILISALVWGVKGGLSAGFGVALVVVNLAIAAASMVWAARIGPTAIVAAALGGFGIRMTLVVIALALVRDQSWVVTAPLAITIVVTHVGLLIWECRRVSLTLAYPVLKPPRTGA